MVINEFLLGETATVKAETRDPDSGNLVAPDAVTITISTGGAAVVTDGVMTAKDIGNYVYYYNTADRGIHEYIIDATIGGLVTKEKGSFRVI